MVVKEHAENPAYQRAGGDGHEKPLFREAFVNRRALIPATGFFEWQKRADGKQPYRFRREDLEPFAFAGLWEFARLDGKDILSAGIIVGEPNPLVSPVHDRMPVILDPADYDRWLDPGAGAGELKALLKPCPVKGFEMFPVSRGPGPTSPESPGPLTPANPRAP